MDGNDKSRFHEDPNGLLVRTAPLDGAAQVYVPTHMRYGVMMWEHYPPQAGHPGAIKMYTSMRRLFYWESMVVDVYAFVANCTQCARNRVGKRRKTNYLKTFPLTEPLTDLCMDLLGPLPRTAAGNEHLLVIVDRFSKMTRAIPLQRIDAETIAAAFLDNWVAAYGPPATVLSDNGPKLRSTFFQGVCSLLGISNRYSTTYHPQTISPRLYRDRLLPSGEGWAVGRFPGQFLRRTELIKRSLRPDDEPPWSCLEPLHFLVDQRGTS